MTVSKNEKFHGLDLLHYCGGGAYGDVYYCKDISGRRMAVKIVYKKKLGDDWQRELRGVINYRKITEKAPELLQIFHVEEDEDTFFYTMEAADSTTEEGYSPDTLAARLKNGPLPKTELYPVLTAIFAGIKTIHDAGFAHRDIKPDNIIFVKGKPKLGDIGLLSSLSATHTQLAGTLDFLPPEERASGNSGTDRRSRQKNDLYAFGKVVYCSITGQSPQDWPALPENLPLTLPLKLFLRLSFSLCDKDPARRLGLISEIQKELDDIKRKLTTGETFRDKLAYQIRRFCINLRSLVIHTGCFYGRHWIVSLIAAACISGGTWYFWPKPPFDITKQKTKLYTNESIGFTMQVPFQWEILSAKTIRGLVAEMKSGENEKDPLEKKRREFLRMIFQSGCDFIVCDFEGSFPESISIQAFPGLSSKDFSGPDDELRYRLRRLLTGDLGFKTEIYEMKRMTVNGLKCIFFDLSLDPEKMRTHNYIFLLPDRCFSVSLTAKSKNFTKLQEEFRQVLNTMKFTKK